MDEGLQRWQITGPLRTAGSSSSNHLTSPAGDRVERRHNDLVVRILAFFLSHLSGST
jgi:hypothetical protein